DLDGVRIDEAAGPLDDGDAGPVEPPPHLRRLGGGDGLLVVEQVIDGGTAAEGEIDAVQCPGADAGEGQGGLAEGLAGDGAGVDGGPADARVPLDDGDVLAE